MSLSPPIMIDSVPPFAPMSPPETGASTLATPLALAASAISTASDGSLVVISTRTLPSFDPASAPFLPSITSRTSLGNPTMAKITSEASATARGESAHTAPFATAESDFDLVRL